MSRPHDGWTWDMPMNRAETRAAEQRYDRILREYGRSLFRIAGSYELEPSRREDLYQDVCLALWQALGSFRGECSERTFVYRIAHNRGHSHAWRRKAAPANLEEAEAVVDPRQDPEAVVVEDQRREHLRRAVLGLPLAARQVVTLALEGLNHQEIAEVLGITENNLAVRLSRARKALQEAFEAPHQSSAP